MNKIYQAFDNIKLDEGVKKKAYQRLEEKHNKQIYTKLIYSISFALAVFIFFIAMSTNNLPQTNEDGNIRILNISESISDIILYKGQRYLLSNDIDVNTIKINKKIGVLKQIDGNADLKRDFESYYHNGYEVYKCNKDNVLIIKSNDDVLAYIKQ